MSWVNGPLTVFHGTDNLSANAIRLNGINPTRFRAATDFGVGFYVTTAQHQAEQWANQRCRRMGGTRLNAEVLAYELPRNDLGLLDHLCFVLDGPDYYDLIAYCRAGRANHGPRRPMPYKVVYGPVSLWPQRLVIANCDQILFSDPANVVGLAHPSASLRPPGSARFF